MIYYGNKHRSIELYQRNKNHVEQKYCYNNVFNIMNHDNEVLKKLMDGEWKVAYCFFNVFDEKNVYVRHACFLDILSNEMIDATSPLLSAFKSRQNLKYWLIRAFSHEEYVSVMSEHYQTPALDKYLKSKTETVRAIMMKENLITIG